MRRGRARVTPIEAGVVGWDFADKEKEGLRQSGK